MGGIFTVTQLRHSGRGIIVILLSLALGLPMACATPSSVSPAESPATHPMLTRSAHKKMFQGYVDYSEGLQGFKVLVMSNRGDWSWRSRATYEAALNDVMTACVGYTILGGCRLFAVGDTIVWDMPREEREKVIAEYKFGKSIAVDTEAPLGKNAVDGFEEYKMAYVLKAFKVFIVADDGAWARGIRPTYEEAVERAMEGCEYYAGRRGTCQLFAV